LSLIEKNSKELINPATYRFKCLIYAMPGTGKTEWVGTAPNVGIAACETGHGKGLLTIASKGVRYVEPANIQEFTAFCQGEVFKDCDTLAIDSLTDMTKTFIKDYALTFVRKTGNTMKRASGVPEMDDYGVMAEVTRRLIRRFLELDKHIIVTATLRLPREADPEEGKDATPAGPDLPGQLFMGSTALFDTVLFLRTRNVLRDPKDAKSLITERFFVTQTSEKAIAKARQTIDGKPLLAKEEIFNLETGQGSFPYLLNKILKGYGGGNA
jgi:hypothetical protein